MRDLSRGRQGGALAAYQLQEEVIRQLLNVQQQQIRGLLDQQGGGRHAAHQHQPAQPLPQACYAAELVRALQAAVRRPWHTPDTRPRAPWSAACSVSDKRPAAADAALSGGPSPVLIVGPLRGANATSLSPAALSAFRLRAPIAQLAPSARPGRVRKLSSLCDWLSVRTMSVTLVVAALPFSAGRFPADWAAAGFGSAPLTRS